MSRSKLIHNRLIECIHNGEVEKEEIIYTLKDIFFYAGLKNLTEYAKGKEITIQAAMKHKDIIELAGKKFHIDYD